MRRCRAASVAPRMAASSRPPSAAATSSGSPIMPACRASALSIAACLRERPSIVDAGAAAGPLRAVAAEQSGRERRGSGGVADPHLAEANQIGVRPHRAVAGCDRGEKRCLVHRRFTGEVGGRYFEIERRDAKRGGHRLRKLVDRGAACGKVRHHLRGDRGRERRHALRRHAVIAGEHQDVDAVEPGRVPPPFGQPRDDLFQPAEAARRLGQLGLARQHGRPRRRCRPPAGRGTRRAARPTSGRGRIESAPALVMQWSSFNSPVRSWRLPYPACQDT